MIRRFFVTTAAVLLASPLSFAQDPVAIIEKRFKQLDTNQDGKLSVEEARSVEFFVKGADANGDGFYTIDEIRNSLQEKIAVILDARQGGVVGDATKVEATPPPMFDGKDSPREEPRRLKAGECGIGLRIADATLTDLEGKARSLVELAGKRPVVFALVSTSCPVSKRMMPSLARLEKEYAAKGVTFILIAPDATDTPSDLRAGIKAAGLTAPCLRDPKNAFLSILGARSTTDMFLTDAAQTLSYRGALDDQYGLGYSLDAPRHRYLADALDSVLDGRIPEIAATEAPGCLLDLGTASAVTTEATYHNRISRLVQMNCLECHRKGGVAPFAMETYDQVVAKSAMIRKMVDRGLMPPWFAAPPAEGAHSPWGNDRSLAARDRADLLAWLGSGKPLGDPIDAPLARAFPMEWEIGKPDAVVQLPNPIDVKADGFMSYKNVTVETGFGEDKWVRGFEIQPTAREVVHHVLVFLQAPGAGAGRGRFEGEDDERGGFFTAYVPGNSHVVYPAGFAKRLPAGAKLRFQIHYTPNGTATQDQMKLAFLFASEPPEHIVRVAGIPGHRLNIPPGANHHPETAILPVPTDVKLLGFTPHMHVRGAAFRYEAILPDGTIHTLLDVPQYDFNWQLSYRYAEPPTLPMGSQIRATGWFDNSAKNPANPDPTKTVRWGPQTYDEMLLGYVEYYVPGEKPEVKTVAR